MENLAAHPNLLYIGLSALILAAGLVLFLFNKIVKKVN